MSVGLLPNGNTQTTTISFANMIIEHRPPATSQTTKVHRMHKSRNDLVLNAMRSKFSTRAISGLRGLLENMKRLEVPISVQSPSIVGVSYRVATTVIFSPDSVKEAASGRILFMLPGAGYSRRYYDMTLNGDPTYSQAAFHANRGDVLVLLDCIGSGESVVMGDIEADFNMLAEAHHLAVQALVVKLQEGTIDDNLSPLCSFKAVGIGQSLGGAVTIITQSCHRTFDALAILGASALHTRIPRRSGSNDDEIDWLYAMHSDETPQNVVALDWEGGYPHRKSVPDFGTANVPSCTFDLLSREDYLAPYAKVIRVPIFLGYGSRDTCGNPHGEPNAYSSASDITLTIVPKMAHMHNFAPTRLCLWKKLGGWLDNID